VDGEGDRSSDQALDGPDREQTERRGHRRADDDRGHARLGHEQRPAADQRCRRHGQHDHEANLRGATAENANEQVGDQHPEDHTAHQLKRALALLAERRAQTDDRGDRGEARLPLGQQQLSQIPRGDGRPRRLQDRPQHRSKPPQTLAGARR
jgi:hypothetical protein